jgi:hypothetical protein
MKNSLIIISILFITLSCNKPDSEKVYKDWKGKWEMIQTEYPNGDVLVYKDINLQTIIEFMEDGTISTTINGVYYAESGFVYPQTGIHLKIKSFMSETTYLTDRGFFGKNKTVTWQNVETKEIITLKKIK